MTTDIALRDSARWLANQLSPADINILRRYVCKPGYNQPAASDDDLMFFLTYCKANNIDAFQKQAYLIPTKQGPQVCLGIDALRGRAAASGDYAGQELPVFSGQGNDLECQITVYRMLNGHRCSFPAVAWLSESKGTTPNWTQRPRGMLEKCAEAKALRKAFPRECGALYTSEELEERDVTPQSTVRAASAADINARLQKPRQAPTMEAEYSDGSDATSDAGSHDLDADGSERQPDNLEERLRSMVAAFDELGGVTTEQLFVRVRSIPDREHVRTFADIRDEDLVTLRELYAELRKAKA